MSGLEKRLAAARDAVEALGPALLSLRRNKTYARYLSGDPYKTSADRAAEAWVVEYVGTIFPDDAILAEEAFERKREEWTAPAAFWTVDALDGTASFVEGYDGFCAQVAYVVDGVPVLGVVHEPVARRTYWAVRGAGAFRQRLGSKEQRLTVRSVNRWPKRPVFIDSTPPKGDAGRLFARRACAFLECGGAGAKICRVADGSAHVLVKSNRFKLWDVAPGHVILSEAGGRMGCWDGSEIAYNSVYVPNLAAASGGLFPLLIHDLRELGSSGNP